MDIDPHVVSYLSGLRTDASKRSMREALAVLARRLSGNEDATLGSYDWTKLDAVAVERVLGQMRDDGKAPATLQHARAAMSGVAQAAWRAGAMEDGVLARIKAVPKVRGQSLRRRDLIDDAEVLALLKATDDATGGALAVARDRAILALLFGGGLRRAEVSGALLEHWDAARKTITVLGKGQKVRSVPLGKDAAALVEAWIAVRRHVAHPRLILATHHRGYILNRGLSMQGLYNALCRLGERAGVEVAPHDARHKRITSLLSSGVDLSLTQRLAGHASPATTVRYDRRGQDALEEAVKKGPGGL